MRHVAADRRAPAPRCSRVRDRRRSCAPPRGRIRGRRRSRSARSARRSGERDREPVRFAVYDAVSERLLSNSKETDGDIGVEVAEVAVRRESHLARRAAFRLRRSAPSGPSPGRAVAAWPDADRARDAESLRTCPASRSRSSTSACCVCASWIGRMKFLRLLDGDRHAGQLLADVVVEIAGDVRARRFLRVDQTSGQLPDPLVARSNRRLTCQDRFFGATPSGSLHEESGDRQQLRGDHDDRADDVPAIGFPHGRREESDLRFRWQPRRVDAPSLDLAPVEGRARAARLRSECPGRACPRESAAPSARPASAGLARAAHHAADDTGADVEIDRAVHRHRRGLRRRFARRPADPAAPAPRFPRCQRWRTMLRGGTALTTSSDVGHRLPVDERELDLARKRAELGSHRVDVLLVRRCAMTNTRFGRRVQLQRQLQRFAHTRCRPGPPRCRRRRCERARPGTAIPAKTIGASGKSSSRLSSTNWSASFVIAITRSMRRPSILPPDVVASAADASRAEPIGFQVFGEVVDRDVGARHQDLANRLVQHRVRWKESATPSEWSGQFGRDRS